MKHCINTKSREFISLHEEYNRFIEPIGEMTLSGKVGAWLDITKVNRIPSLEELLSPLNNTEIKEGVVELFESNPELANAIYEALGFEIPKITPQQKLQAQQVYSQYLDTIFPNSKVKDIVYHSRFTPANILNKDRWKNGFYSGTKEQADLMADMAEISNRIMITSALLIDIKNPKITDYTDREVENYKTTNDSFIIEATKQDALQLIGDRDGYNIKNFKKEYVVFNPEQIHILGSKQDILGFKQYIKDTKINTINLEIVRLKKAITELHHEIAKTIPDSLKIARFAEFYQIGELGYFNNKPDPNLLLQDIKKLNVRGLGVAIAESGNPYLTRDGKMYKPHKNIQRGVSANSLIKQYMKEQYAKSVQMQNLYEKLEYEEFKKQLEKDCIITAKDGLSTSFTPNGKWEIIKDLTGLPKHSQGGVDLMISNGRVNFKRS